MHNGLWIQSYINRSRHRFGRENFADTECCLSGNVLIIAMDRRFIVQNQPRAAKVGSQKLPSLGMLWWEFVITESSKWAPNGSKSLSIGGKARHERHGIFKCTRQQNNNYEFFTTCVNSADYPQAHCIKASSDYDVAFNRSFWLKRKLSRPTEDRMIHVTNPQFGSLQSVSLLSMPN